MKLNNLNVLGCFTHFAVSDSEEEITRKVMSAVTDPNRIKKDDLGNPDVCMVAYYHNLFSSKDAVEKAIDGLEKKHTARKTARKDKHKK